MPTQFEEIAVPQFGGGLNLQAHPGALDPSEWAGCDGFMALDGAAEQVPTFATFQTLVAITGDPIGLLPYAFADDRLLVVTEDTGDAKLATLGTNSGVETLMTRVGGAANPSADEGDLATTAFLNGYQVVSCGIRTTAGNRSSLVRLNNGTTYDTIDQPASENLRAQGIVSAAGHIVAAGCRRLSANFIDVDARTIAWSSSNDESLWLPAVSNDADDVVLDDVSSPITAILNLGPQAVGIFTRENIYVLTPTASIPSFTRSLLLSGVGAGIARRITLDDYRRIAVYGEAPRGVVVVGNDRLFYISGSQVAEVGAKIVDFYFQKLRQDGSFDVRKQLRPIVYHPVWRQVIVPRLQEDGDDLLLYNVGNDAWGRVSLGGLVSGNGRRMVVARSTAPRLFILSDTLVVTAESGATIPDGFANATVDTKDFSMAGSRLCYVDSVVVDWESIGTTAGVLQVGIASRNDFGVVGSLGRDMSLSYTTQGTLTFAASVAPSEQKARKVGRYHRIRFTATAGRARIRGFTVRLRAAGDRIG
jgi:hypothetical protein